MTQRKNTAIPPDVGPLVDDGIDLVIPALEDEHSEDLVKQVVAEGVIVPRVRNRLKYESEWYAECYRPEPTWMVEFVLSDAAGEWATPDFEVYDDDYVEH